MSKHQAKKFNLRKQTIANLEQKEMKRVYGGLVLSKTNCVRCWNPTDTDGEIPVVEPTDTLVETALM